MREGGSEGRENLREEEKTRTTYDVTPVRVQEQIGVRNAGAALRASQLYMNSIISLAMAAWGPIRLPIQLCTQNLSTLKL